MKSNDDIKRGLQASSLKKLSKEKILEKVVPLFIADRKISGILPSVSLAQFILESDFGKSELAQNANNVFGMKNILSENNWPGSSWDGVSVYVKETTEEYEPGVQTVKFGSFRKYACLEDSVSDHSAYLLGAMKNDKKRYAGLPGCTDHKEALHILTAGGYSTFFTYELMLRFIIEKYDLTRFDQSPILQS